MWIAALLLLGCSLVQQIQANVIGIDFASDSIKVAIVQPGTPLEIVTNFQSKRKTPTCISFYRGERLFGSDAYALMGRKPDLTFANIYRLLGRSADHPIVREFSEQYFPYQIYTNETTGSLALKLEETFYTPEELVALMLQHVKDMTLNFGGHAIKDCVITVPSSFTQHEREAVYTAADIADLRVLSLIEENTAAALHYGIDRTFDEPTVVMFYNMGAGSVQVTIVSYSSYGVKEMGKNKTVGQFEVLGKAWDSSLGGFNFDVRLAEMLATRFNDAWAQKLAKRKIAVTDSNDLRKFLMPMTKLRIQANKVKEVLSANSEFPVKMEQLHADVDLNTKVTRNEFETACDDLFARLTVPIDEALRNANVTMKQVHAVELLGGGVRMPKVKKLLDEYFNPPVTTTTASDGTGIVDAVGKVELGQHLNGDEAMALGAAFKAANLSTAFRVRKIGANDITSFGISVRLEAIPTTVAAEDNTGATVTSLFGNVFGGSNTKKAATDAATDAAAASVWHKYTSLYPVRSSIPAKTKTVAFQYDQDISCRIEYDDATPLPAGTDKVIAIYNITGIAAFARDNSATAAATGVVQQPKVHLSFNLDVSGIVKLVKADVTLELPPAAVVVEGDVVNGNNTSNENTANTTDASSTDSTAGASSNDTTTASASTDDNKKKNSSKKNSKDNSSSSKKGGSKDSKEKDTHLRQSLNIIENPKLVVPAKWTTAQINEARARRYALKQADDERKAIEAALNELEGYIYKVKNTFADQEEELKAVSTEEQRNAVIELADAAENWLYEDGSKGQSVAIYKDKQKEIRVAADAIFKRHRELSLRAVAVARANKALNAIVAKMSAWDLDMPHITVEEKEGLQAAIRKVESWIDEKTAQQAAASPYESPVFESNEVPAQIRPVSNMFEKLISKPKPAPPVIVTEKNATNNASNDSTNAENTEELPTTVKVEVEKEGDDEDDVSESSSSVEDTDEEL